MASGYLLTSGDLAIQVQKVTNYWKALLSATETYLQRIIDIGNTAISLAYQNGGSPTYIQDLIDLGNANAAMTNVINYASYTGSASKTDNTGGAGLSAPPAPVVTPQGPAGPTAGVTASYQVIAHTLNGTTPGYTGTPPGAGVGSTTNGWAALTSTNFNALYNYAVAGATSYDILKWTGSAWALLATTTLSAFYDTGQSTSAYAVPTTNTTGGLAAPTAPVPTTSTTGGTIPAAVFGVIVSYVNANGETTGSAAGTITTTGTTSTITVPSPAAAGAGGLTATGWYAYVTQGGGSTYTRQQAPGSPTAIGTALTLSAPPTSTGAQPPAANNSAVPVSVSVPAGSLAVVTSDPTIIAYLKPAGSDQTPAIRKPSDLTAGQL